MAMAEQKYNLALISTVTDKKIRSQPWYKERLKTKYIKSLKPSDTSKCLVGKNWIFVKDGLDDFRDGLPPTVEGNVFLKVEKGPGPTISGDSDNVSAVKQAAMPKRFDKEQVCFARVTPQQQQRRQHIDEIECGLLRHPLALYPHLEESVAPELFEDIVDILDPEMNMESSEEGSEEDDLDEAEEVADAEESKEDVKAPEVGTEEKDEAQSNEEILRNLYRWLPRKEEKKEKKKPHERKSNSPSQERHIQNVTREFCEWVASLGGESNNIEESTITSLFASGYETKPALSVPIHVVELTNVPQELRMSASAPQPQESTSNVPKSVMKKKKWEYSGNYEPSWVKFKYGAWYLDPKTWQKRDHNIPLIDPKELKNQEMSEAKKRSNDLNIELSQMHGSNAFMEFIEKKQTRKPEFSGIPLVQF
ncbi:protein FAM47E-like isoform X2 [Gigantopelta aegis]|uniref:protein FAM47E-like isoform X2 n=1 Tax=Gigantopelta aegis TaxID=1735272 RepID=UPI001B88D67B|nr:protein FAM47E-like isoform X2 [Gigantopelta aegis]